MFKEMRRKKQRLDEGVTKDILRAGSYGILAVAGNDGYPYTVPLNYIYLEQDPDSSSPLGAIYFHCATEGHKIDAIQSNPKSCFCVVDRHDVMPDDFATAYTSAVAFGQVSIASSVDAERALYTLGEKYNPGAHEAIRAEIAKDGPRCLVLKMSIEHLSGKRSLKLP